MTRTKIGKRRLAVSDAVVLLVGVATVLMLVPKSMLRQRANTRAFACLNNLKQIGLAFHNYHSAYKKLPAGTGGTYGNEDPAKSNGGRLGPLVGILPFVEQQRLWEQISNPFSGATSGQEFPPMGPLPQYDPRDYTPWGKSPSVYHCPDVGNRSQAQSPKIINSLQPPLSSMGVTTSYVASFGDGTSRQGVVIPDLQRVRGNELQRKMAADRGAFLTSRQIGFRDFLDGLSNTIFFSEVVDSRLRKPGVSEVIRDVTGLSQKPSLCLKAAADQPSFWKFGRGALWSDGRPTLSGFQTVLPPNSPSCTSDLGIDEPVVSAASLHSGGVHVLMGDGAVRFITDTIDAGDPDSPGVAIGDGFTPPGSRSPYGLWGALGTRASAEAINREFSQQRIRHPRPIPTLRDLLPQTSTPKLSQWSDKTKQHQLMAEFIEIRDKKTVRLRHASGNIHEVPLNSLSPSDVYRAIEMDVMRQAKQRD